MRADAELPFENLDHLVQLDTREEQEAGGCPVDAGTVSRFFEGGVGGIKPTFPLLDGLIR